MLIWHTICPQFETNGNRVGGKSVQRGGGGGGVCHDVVLGF